MSDRKLFRVHMEDGGEWFPDRGWVPDTHSFLVRAINWEHAEEIAYERTDETMGESRRVVKVERVKEGVK